MHLQSFDYPFPFIEAPQRPQGIDKKIKEHIGASALQGNIVSETGSDGAYKGVLEVSQDVTDIRGLTGQRRLLDWA